MKKLVKLKDHYYVVDDSEIKEGDFCITDNTIIQMNNRVAVILANQQKEKYGTKSFFKITHSTTPLNGVILLSHSEIEELVNGYSVEEMAEQAITNNPKDWIKGFKAHESLVKDKLFTIENMREAFFDMKYPHDEVDFQHLLQRKGYKTEWDIEIDENNKITLI